MLTLYWLYWKTAEYLNSMVYFIGWFISRWYSLSDLTGQLLGLSYLTASLYCWVPASLYCWVPASLYCWVPSFCWSVSQPGCYLEYGIWFISVLACPEESMERKQTACLLHGRSWLLFLLPTKSFITQPCYYHTKRNTSELSGLTR